MHHFVFNKFGAVQACLADISKTSGVNVSMDSLHDSDQSPSQSSAEGKTVPSSSTGSLPQTVAEMKSMTYQASVMGFVPGAYVTQKKDIDVYIYIIESISDAAGAKMECNDKSSVTCTVDDLMHHWRVHKGRIEQLMTSWVPPCDSAAWNAETVRGIINYAAMTVTKKYVTDLKLIDIYTNPTSVKAKTDIPAGSLHLVAASQRLVDKKPPSGAAYKVGDFDVDGTVKAFYMTMHFVGPTAKDGTPNRAPFCCPFWVVGTADKPKAANVEIQWESVTVGEYRVDVPMYTNKSDLTVGDELQASPKAPQFEPPIEKGPKRRRG